MKALTPLTADV